jgi:hypothetical protein
MSTELPFLEGQFDAFFNSLWWSLDEKFGKARKSHRKKSFFSSSVGSVWRIWDNVILRLALAASAPYLLGIFIPVAAPGNVALKTLVVCIVGPWLYRIWIYNPFFDPLRHLPEAKAALPRASLIVGPLAIWTWSGYSKRRCNSFQVSS